MTYTYSSWGYVYDGIHGARDSAKDYWICVPRAPGCEKLMDSDDVEQVFCRYTVRAHYTASVDDVMSISFYPMMEPATTITLNQSAVFVWDSVSTAATESDEYPGNGSNFNGEWTRDNSLPCSLMCLSFWKNTSDGVTGTLSALAVGVHWDEDTNPSEDVPVWDWSSAAISDTQMPASSCVVMKALAETYNRMIWGSIWEIQAAIP